MQTSAIGLVSTIKTVAKNITTINNKKAAIQEKIDTLQEQIDALTKQQEILESPIVQLTNGYTIDDLMIIKTEDNGVTPKGKPRTKTTYEFKYPDTIIPPTEQSDVEDTQEEKLETSDDEVENTSNMGSSVMW